MTQEPTDVEVLAAVLGEEAALAAGDHPEESLLLDYHCGELAPEVEKRLQDHLVGCRACTRTLLELEPFAEAAQRPANDVADIAATAGWRDFKATIGQDEPLALGALSGRPHWAVAASLLVAVIGLSVWVTQLRSVNTGLRRTVAEMSEPQINPPVVYLDETTRSDASDSAVAELSSQQPFVLLIVVHGNLQAHSRYEVELLDETDNLIWRGTGFELSEEGTLRLRLPRRLLPAGNYRVTVDGLEGARKEVLVDSSFRVRYR